MLVLGSIHIYAGQGGAVHGSYVGGSEGTTYYVHKTYRKDAHHPGGAGVVQVNTTPRS